MATQRRQRPDITRFTRLAHEIYVGVLVVGAVIVAAAVVGMVVAIAMQVNDWVTAID